MKRSGLRRKTPLKADPEATRAFVQRGRESISPDPEKTAEFVRRGRESSARALANSARKYIPARTAKRRAEGPLSPAAWRKSVYDASGGLCIISRTRADGPDDARFDAHHVLPKGELRARGLVQFVWDARNGLWLAERVHQRHEGAFLRIPRSKVPPAAWAFARELDALDGTEWATVMLERNYPAAGCSGTSTRRS